MRLCTRVLVSTELASDSKISDAVTVSIAAYELLNRPVALKLELQGQTHVIARCQVDHFDVLPVDELAIQTTMDFWKWHGRWPFQVPSRVVIQDIAEKDIQNLDMVVLDGDQIPDDLPEGIQGMVAAIGDTPGINCAVVCASPVPCGRITSTTAIMARPHDAPTIEMARCSLADNPPQVNGEDSGTEPWLPSEIRVKVLERPFPTNIIRPSPRDLDPDVFVFASMMTLSELDILSGSWVTLKAGANARHAVLYGIYDSWESAGDLYVSPQLFYLLDSPGRVAIRFISDDPLGGLPAAESITISWLPNLDYLEDRELILDVAVQKVKRWARQHQRIVQEGDIIPIDINAPIDHLRLEPPTPQRSGSHSSTTSTSSKRKMTEIDEQIVCSIEESYGARDGIKPVQVFLKVVDTSPHLSDTPVAIFPDNTKVTLKSSSKRIDLRRLFLPKKYDAFRTPCVNKERGILKSLVESRVRYGADERMSCYMVSKLLVAGPEGSGKKSLIYWTGEELGVPVWEINCRSYFPSRFGDDMLKIATLMDDHIKACRGCPYILFLRNVNWTHESAFAHVMKNLQVTPPVIVIGSLQAESLDDVEKDLRNAFEDEILLEALSGPEIREYLQQFKLGLEERLVLPLLSGLTLGEMVQVIEASRISAAEESGVPAGSMVKIKHVKNALADVRSRRSNDTGAPSIPQISWGDVGGLQHVKTEVLDTIELPLRRPEMFSSGLKKRSGILLYGPPGTGKTLVAKACATNFSMHFMSVKGPELLNMYVGESEANVRRIFASARRTQPVLLFFDELDAVAPRRGGGAGGAVDRVVSQLLTEMDGVHGSSRDMVFVMGATNRVDLIDAALMRPGRFDKLLFIDVPEDVETKTKVFQAQARKLALDPDCDLRKVAELCPRVFTGADIYAACTDAMLEAVRRHTDANGHKDDPTGFSVMFQDFQKALQGAKGSVSESELRRYRMFKRT